MISSASVLACFAFGAISLLFAYLAFTGEQPTVFKDHQGNIIAIRDFGRALKLAASVAVVVGFLFWWWGLRQLLRGGAAPQNDSGRPTRCSRRSQRAWLFVNIALFVLAIWTGYSETTAAQLKSQDRPIALCAAAAFGMALLAVGAPYFARSDGLQRPTLNRNPFCWWSDPLQAVFVSTFVCFGLLAGSILSLFVASRAAIWMVPVFGSMLLGLIAGQVIAYQLYAKWLIASEKGRKGAGD